jgi:oligoendopeptidase F
MALRSTTPNRSDVVQEDTWDLTSLFSTDADWEVAFEELRTRYLGILEFRGRLAESAETLTNCLVFEREIDLLTERLQEYAMLRVSEDSSNATALEREARLLTFSLQLREAFSFIAPEIQRIPDDVLDQWLSQPELQEWRTSLYKIRRTKSHTLAESEERILALAGGALEGASDIFSQLTNVDMKFGCVRDEEGREVDLTQSSLSSFLLKRDGRIRKEAFEKFYTEFSDHQYSLAAALASSVRGDVFRARARNFSSARAAALFYDDIPLSVYDNLIDTVRANLPCLHRYYALRRRVLKLAETHVYDTTVSLVPSIQTDIRFEEAVEKVLAAVAPLGEEYTTVLRKGLTSERWCDRFENKGKRSGAFSAGSYSAPPYILMNYKRDVFSDVYTLAHEAGHSMHTWYSRKAQKFQDYHYPIFLAEVASTFNEMLLTEYLLAETNDSAMRAYLLNRQIDDLRGTLFRQTMFAEFEKIIHDTEEAGQALTLDFFRSIYRSLLGTYFGNEVIIDNVLELECLRIPHFYSAFYVYKYATGISAAVALSRKVLEEQETSAYLGFLQSGGSQFPIPTLKSAGVDMNSPEPIQNALDLFAQRVEELETLLG